MCVPVRLVRLASFCRSSLLNLSSSCQGRSLCLEGQEEGWEAGPGGHVTLGLRAPSLASVPSLMPASHTLRAKAGPRGRRLLMPGAHLSQVTCTESPRWIGLPSEVSHAPVQATQAPGS